MSYFPYNKQNRDNILVIMGNNPKEWGWGIHNDWRRFINDGYWTFEQTKLVEELIKQKEFEAKLKEVLK